MIQKAVSIVHQNIEAFALMLAGVNTKRKSEICFFCALIITLFHVLAIDSLFTYVMAWRQGQHLLHMPLEARTA